MKNQTNQSLRNLLHLINVFIACSISLVSCSQQMSEHVQDMNAGFNGSFEAQREGLPLNWICYTQKTTGEGDFDMVLENADAKAGNTSLKFNVRSCSDKGGRFSPGIANEIDVKAGEKYRISFWIKGSGTIVMAHVSGVNAFNSATKKSVQLPEKSDTWHKVEIDYQIPEKMNRLRFEMNVLKPGVVSIDDVSIAKQ